MHTACTACCDDDGLCPCYQIISRLHVQKNGTCHLILLIADQLHCGGKLHYRDTTVDDFITQGTHDLSAGIILARMHSLSGGSASVRRDHCAVCVLVKHNAQLIQPFDRIRCLHDQLFQKLRPCRKMPAAKCIKIMLYRRIIFFIRCLNAALCHHCICIADTKLRHDHNIRACLMCLNCCGSTCSAAADDKHIHIIIEL